MKIAKPVKWITAPLWLPLLPLINNGKRMIRSHDSQIKVIQGLLGKNERFDDKIDEIEKPRSFEDAVTQAEKSWAENGHDFSVQKVMSMLLLKKRLILAATYFSWIAALILLSRGEFLNSITLMLFGVLSIAFIFPSQFHRWQIANRRLTAEERGGVEDFRKETHWFFDCLNPELSRKTKNTLLSIMLIALMISPIISYAANLDEITDAADSNTDLSRQALVTIFGQVVNDPLAVGNEEGGDTLIAQIFKVFSSALLIIATATTGYLILKKTAHGAHEGQFLDNQQHSLWMPIRILSGITMLVPTANGWSLSQLMMLYAASKVGVGAANLGSNAAVDAFMSGQTFVLQPVAPSTASLAHALFEANLCMFGINASLDQVKSGGGLVYSSDYVNQQPITNGFILRSSSFTCGGATMAIEQQETLLQQLGVVASIDTTALRAAHQQGLEAMQDALLTGAESFVNGVLNKQQNPGGVLPNAEATIQAASQIYENRVTAALNSQTNNGQLKNLSHQIAESIKSDGWWALGGWYQTMAVANTRITDASGAKSSAFGKSSDQLPATSEVYALAESAFRAQQSVTDNTNAGVLTAKSSYQRNEITDASSLFNYIFNDFGQSLTNALISNSIGETGQVNPLIAMKSVGDYLMIGSEAGLGTYAIATAAVDAANESLLGKGVNALTGLGEGVRGFLASISPFIVMILVIMMSAGIALSIYLPMMPFIIWTAACINWVIIVGEGIFAAPLWAYAHLNGEGEGMGPKTTHGYIFLFNMMIRPILMVGGFFLGGGILVIGGTIINKMLPGAIANAQFDSVTGIGSVIGYIVLYCGMCITLVGTSFSLINIVPDQVINWVGGHMSNHLGREMTDKVGNTVNVLAGKTESTMGRSSGRIHSSSNKSAAPAPESGIK